MKKISIVTACYNEEDNIFVLYSRVKSVCEKIPGYTFEHIFIDNASTDNTIKIIKEIAKTNDNVKLIVNTRNFGPVRSGHHGLMQAEGEAVISIVADLQEPPEIIPEFIAQWEKGYKVVIGKINQSHERQAMYIIRNLFYRLMGMVSEIKQIKGFTGFGLYDKKVMDIIRDIDDPYPYFRGIICDIGFDIAKIEYVQPKRERGISKHNFYTLYDLAVLGLTNHSKVPLRLATMLGFLIALFSFVVAIGYFVYKLLYWNSFQLGLAPLTTGLFFFGAVQLFFIGIIGEYIGSIHTQVLKRPLVIEKERINF
jgi:polyisoprenyl-phosphate glycosyltransferase